MYCLTVILSLCLAVNALYGQLRDQRVLGKTTCGNPKLVPQCCYSLDYSGKDVACVGPGAVEYLEECLHYDPRPMCCCGFISFQIPNGPEVPGEITCDKDCHALYLKDGSGALDL